MKSKQFLKEAGFGIGMDLFKPTGDDKEVKRWASLITKHCQPYLQEANGLSLYRGLGRAKDPFMKKRVRLGNRTPKDMPQDLHKKLNKYFEMKFGAPFRNAMFVTGDDGVANEYGAVYTVYPIGEFEYLWSLHVHDLYSIWENYLPWFDRNDNKKEEKKKLKEAYLEFYNEEIKYGYQTTDLNAAIKSGHEIMLRCSNYYAVRHDMAEEINRIL